VIVDELEYTARHDQNAADLIAALRTAGDKATRLIVTPPPVIIHAPVVDPPVVHPPVVPPPVVTPPVLPPPANQRQVSTQADLTDLERAIKAELDAGRSVTVTWEVR
jgi:hypothetical protein